MFLVGVVTALIFTSLCIWTYFTEELEISDSLENNLSIARENGTDLSNAPQNSENRIYDVSFTVLIDTSRNVISKTQTDVDDVRLAKLINDAMSIENPRGNLNDENLSFLRADVREGKLISFISREHLTEKVQHSITQYVIASIFALILFLFISKINYLVNYIV